MINLTQDQKAALTMFQDFILNSDETFMIIQGDSGTGKTTLINEMLKRIQQNKQMYALLQQPDSIKWTPVLTATTNKAAAALRNIIQREVTTIHSFMNLIIKPNYQTGEELLTPNRSYVVREDFLIIIDEASFIDNNLFQYIQKGTKNCKIILIGDKYQLAPVKQIEPIMSTLATPYYVELTEIVRHTGNIATLGKQFKKAVITCIFAPIKYNDTDIIYATTDTLPDLIKNNFQHNNYIPSDARTLAWTNNCVITDNKHIRKIKHLPPTFAMGEYAIINKALVLDNKANCITADTQIRIVNMGTMYEQYGINGRDVTCKSKTKTITAFLPDDTYQVKQLLKRAAKTYDWETYFKVKQGWLDLRSAYASTIHKSQGSEFKTVFLDLTDIGKCNKPTDVARLLYVGITRATEQVILHGKLPEKYGGAPIAI